MISVRCAIVDTAVGAVGAGAGGEKGAGGVVDLIQTSHSVTQHISKPGTLDTEPMDSRFIPIPIFAQTTTGEYKQKHLAK